MTFFRASGLALFVVAASGCAPPTLTAVVPGSGYPRQLLAVNGTTGFAAVVWDVGGNEKVLYNGVFGTQYFQIPTDATPGDHAVAIRNSKGTSSSVTVTVLPSSGTFPAPRIEDFGILATVGNGPVDLAMTVAAANLDVDATVSVTETLGAGPAVNRNVRFTGRWGALPVDYLQHHTPSTFGYPVYHYTQLVTVVEGVRLGSTLHVTVTNTKTDGLSASRDFRMPHRLAALDGDGDGLLDAWEDSVYTAQSGGTVPLAAIGAHKWKKDVLVEVDWIKDAAPDRSMWPRVRSAFSEAPVLNPDGSHGINLIVDNGTGGLTNGGEELPDHELLSFGNGGTVVNGKTVTDFFDYKAQHFDSTRLHVFHYAVLGRSSMDGRSGRGEVFGNDFYVTMLDPLWASYGIDGLVGTFMHELGHNLGLTHGNLNPSCSPALCPDQQAAMAFKPNLPSVMNYRFTGGVDMDCDLIPDGLFTYSQGTLKPIDEATVDEKDGICDGKPVDMDPPTGLSVGVDFDQDGVVDQWLDMDQWGHLQFDFDDPKATNSEWGNN
jgi:hypothetical protein